MRTQVTSISKGIGSRPTSQSTKRSGTLPRKDEQQLVSNMLLSIAGTPLGKARNITIYCVGDIEVHGERYVKMP